MLRKSSTTGSLFDHNGGTAGHERRFSQHYLIAFYDKAVDITALPASTTPEAQSWRRQSLAVLRIGLSQPPNLRCLEIGQPYPDLHRRHGHRLQSLHCQVWDNDDVKVLSKSLAHRRHPLLKSLNLIVLGQAIQVDEIVDAVDSMEMSKLLKVPCISPSLAIFPRVDG